MEEKERYVIRYDLDYNRCLIDTEKNQGVGDYIQIVKLLNQQDKENKQLKQQLAEKNKEIEKLNACVDFYKSYYISFNEKVIDELDKVKRYIDDKAYYVEEENFGIEINEYIDNQINVLRNNKDGIH